MDKKYFRYCPNDKCDNIINYKHIGDMRITDKKGTVCNECRYVEVNSRNGRIINYLNNTELTHKEIGKLLIGHPSNLEVIKWEDNLNKFDKCNITIDELISKSTLFLTETHKILL